VSKTFIGDFCAHVPSDKVGAKGNYKKIGAVFRDERTGAISVKIDTLPVPGSGWLGWCNVFQDREQSTANTPAPTVQHVTDDDLPF
jgi:hypothetical protein